MSVESAPSSASLPQLARSLTLTHAVLYGLGVTIGAGIYVLVGIAAGRSGMHAPLAFIGAAIVMGFSAASFAELGTRMPVSASEAAYVDAAFHRKWLSLGIGLLVIATATVSAATISVGSAGCRSVSAASSQLDYHLCGPCDGCCRLHRHCTVRLLRGIDDGH